MAAGRRGKATAFFAAGAIPPLRVVDRPAPCREARHRRVPAARPARKRYASGGPPATLRRMWVLSAIAALGTLAMVAWIVALLVSSLRQPAEPPTPGTPPRLRRRSPGLLIVALLLAGAATALAVMAAVGDAHESRYQIAWMAILPGVLALAGIAAILTLLAAPKPARTAGIEVLVWLLGLGAFGIFACYGLLLTS